MTSTAIILAALSIFSGSTEQMDLDQILGDKKDQLIQEVEKLNGSKLTQIRETLDILANFNLDIQRSNIILANNSEAEGVSYSTDPPEDRILPV
ncbi:MAG: hypothetical protein JJU12_08655 [Chlamydiales bacterium]|nr:hypothetical protein [Chlamydiales bacterium]